MQTGATCLHYAGGMGHADVVRELLERGADIGATDAVRLVCKRCMSDGSQQLLLYGCS